MKRNYKKFLGIGLALSMMVALLVGCGNSTPQGSGAADGGSTGTSTPREETLIFIGGGEPFDLAGLNSPMTGLDSCSTDFLLDYNNDTLEAEPCLAESWEEIDDGTHTKFRFTLRDGLTFNDGTPLTAEDVRFCLECYVNAGKEDTGILDMENTVVEDDQHLVIALKNYSPGWEYMFSDALPIYSKASVEAIGLENTVREAPATIGKYNFKEWKPGEYILYERNDNYWDPNYKGYYKYIKCIWVADIASGVLAVKSGDADIAYGPMGISVVDYKGLENDPYAEGLSFDISTSHHVIYNCESGPCSDVRVREALSYALDKDSMNMILNMGQGKPIQGLFLDDFPYYKEYYPGGVIPYDPAKAKELLEQAGYSNLTLTCLVTSDYKDAATAYQESLRNIGVTLNVDTEDFLVLMQRAYSGDFDLSFTNATNAVVNAQNFNHVDPAKIGQSPSNCRFVSDDLSAAIQKASAYDEAERAAGYDEVCKIIFDNYCLTGICNGYRYAAVKKGLTDVKVGTRMGYLDVSYVHPAE